MPNIDAYFLAVMAAAAASLGAAAAREAGGSSSNSSSKDRGSSKELGKEPPEHNVGRTLQILLPRPQQSSTFGNGAKQARAYIHTSI